MHSAHGCDLWVSVSPSVTEAPAVGLPESDEASGMGGTSRWCLGSQSEELGLRNANWGVCILRCFGFLPFD